MNQQNLKEHLLRLEEDVEEFSVIFSGKKSKKVDGLYHPDTREIVIHNKNMSTENEILYTGIHEFAHHIHFTRSPVPISAKSHTSAFRNIFHTLLEKAERMNIYSNPFNSEGEFIQLTEEIRKECIGENGRLMKRLGSLLLDGVRLCKKYHVSYEDYFSRVLQIPSTTAKTLLQVSSLDINPEIGFENMSTVARIKEPGKRQEAEEAFIRGESPERIKNRFLGKPVPEESGSDSRIEVLEKEKRRIERTIQSLQQRLETIKDKLSGLNRQS